jgi:uncharacterized membrane protein
MGEAIMKTLDVAVIGICGALYAVVGYLIYIFLPITAPGIGIVRFWPSVVIPAVFAVLFGPLVGGFGAALGIFISDTLIHNDPLLSITVGVTSNFIGFYVLGYMTQKKIDWTKMVAILSLSIMIIELCSLAFVSYISFPQVTSNSAQALNQTAFNNLVGTVTSTNNAFVLFTSISIVIFAATIVVAFLWEEWRNYVIASMFGLGIGSIIIGFGVWSYSQLFILPSAVGGGFQLPLYTSLIWFIWTFATEIPFLITLGPPILKVCYKAFPSIAPQGKE